MKAIVTVTDEHYFAGTQVLLYSILRYNPNYQGDFVIIHDQLPQALQHELKTQFSVCFEQVSKELKEKLSMLATECPQFSNRLQRFWSVEMFRLTQYDQLLFLDSDVLCKGSITELFKLENELAACADLSYYRGQVRDRTSFELTDAKQEELHGAFEQSFSAGVFLVNRKDNQVAVYKELLQLIEPRVFGKVSSGHTDQYLLNQYFVGKVHWLNASYNYILREEEFIHAKTGIACQEAVLWHYIRKPKPWNFKRLLKNKWKGKAIPPYVKDWHATYLEVLGSKKGNTFSFNGFIKRLMLRYLG